MRNKVTIKGTQKLRKALATGYGMHAVKETIKYHGASLQAYAQLYAPVKTGFLKREIKPPVYSGDGLTATVVSAADYSPYLEYGTRFMSARPFMKPALNVVQAHFLEDIERLVK